MEFTRGNLPESLLSPPQHQARAGLATVSAQPIELQRTKGILFFMDGFCWGGKESQLRFQKLLSPNQTFHHEREAKTLTIPSRHHTQPLGTPAAVYSHCLHFSHGFHACRGWGGGLLPSSTGSVRTVEYDYTGPRRVQPWFLGVGRTKPCLSDPKICKIGWQVAPALLLFLPMAKDS